MDDLPPGLRLIIGRAGTGKTWTCVREIQREASASENGPPLVFLVPEQATHQMERALLCDSGLSGSFRASVLSFKRLAWRVLGEVGGAARRPIGEPGKRAILAAVLRDCAGELRVFGDVARHPGAVERVWRMISEFHEWGVSVEALTRASREVRNPLLSLKLSDAALIYSRLEERLRESFTDPDDHLSLLASRIGRSSFLSGALVWVDGFAGFTLQEYEVLSALMKSCRTVTVALCLDPVRPHAGTDFWDPFHHTARTRKRLEDLASKNGVQLNPPLVLGGDGRPHRFRSFPRLAKIEAEYFAEDGTNASWKAETEGSGALTIVKAPDRRAEVREAAREIIRLVRDRGFKFREIAVIVRDLAPYADLIHETFRRYGIPHFIDRKRRVLHHPAVELIRAAVETVGRDWAYEPVFRMARTGLLPVDRDEIDVLENFVLKHGLRGKPWYAGMEQTGFVTPGYIAAIRNRAFEAVLAFGERLTRDSITVAEACDGLRSLLKALDVEERLEIWAAEGLRTGDLEASATHSQMVGVLYGFLDEVAEAVGDRQVTPSAFLGILEAGLSGLTVGLIPPSLDEVLVGAIDRSRQPDLRAALILGVCERGFPAPTRGDIVFNDGEREELESLGFEMGPYGSALIAEEQFLVYIALTRASERLWLSFPCADEQGRPSGPSSAIARLIEIFPDVFVEEAGIEGRSIESRAEVVPFLVDELREAAGGDIRPEALQVYNWAVRDDGMRAVLPPILKGLRYRNRAAQLPQDLAGYLYAVGGRFEASVTQLERAAACPFAHFLAYGLRLRERPVLKLEAPALGSLFHLALSRMVGYIVDSGINWPEMSDEDNVDLGRRALRDVAGTLEAGRIMTDARREFLMRRLEESFGRVALVVGRHARRGRFRPVGVEVEFGTEGAALPPVLIPAGSEVVRLKGKIDRIDVAEDGRGRRFVRIIDYKRTARRFSMARVSAGVELQVLAYLIAAVEGAEGLLGARPLPAGAFYYPASDQTARETGPCAEEPVRSLLRRARMDGVFVDDPEILDMLDSGGREEPDMIPRRNSSRRLAPQAFDRLLKEVRRRLEECGRVLVTGRTCIEPLRIGAWTACEGCPYRPVCGFDRSCGGNAYRTVTVKDQPDAAEDR